MKIEKKEMENYTLIELQGRLDSFNSPLLHNAFEDLHKGSKWTFVIDLSGVEFINSTTLGLFIDTYKKNKENKGDLFLLNCSNKVMKILQITRLDNVFEIFASLDGVEKRIRAIK